MQDVLVVRPHRLAMTAKKKRTSSPVDWRTLYKTTVAVEDTAKDAAIAWLLLTEVARRSRVMVLGVRGGRGRGRGKRGRGRRCACE